MSYYSLEKFYNYCYKIIEQEIQNGNIILKNNFLYLPNTKILVRNRHKISKKFKLNLGNFDIVPIEEIELAAYEIIKIELGIEEKELAKLIENRIGTPYRSRYLKNAISCVLDNVKSDKNIVFRNNKCYKNCCNPQTPRPHGRAQNVPEC